MTAQPPARPGSIVLARHGEPDIVRSVKLTAQGYRDYWANYETRGLLPGQTPPAALQRWSLHAGVLIASTRPRAIESAQAVAGGRDFAREPILVEAPLPPPDFPDFIRLTPRMWGVVARTWWWFFNHHEGQETRDQALARSEAAAAFLEAPALAGQDVVVLAHGFFNFMVGRALGRRGWRLAQSQGWKYWSLRRFERK